jgi:hypothetical protein
MSPFANKQILLPTLLAIQISGNKKKKNLSETEELFMMLQNVSEYEKGS